MADFYEELARLATYLSVDPVALVTYAAEDHIGGRDTGPWNYLAVTALEGAVLYAVTRAIDPYFVAEIGVGQGCSSQHFLEALAYSSRWLYSVDHDGLAGSLVTRKDTYRWNVAIGDGLAWLMDMPKSRTNGLIFEDSLHEYDHVCTILTAARALNPVLLICHDVLSFEGVARAWCEVCDGPVFRFSPDAGGLGFWRSDHA